MDLINNLMKLMFVEGLDTTSQLIDGMKLPYVVLLQVLDAVLPAEQVVVGVNPAEGLHQVGVGKEPRVQEGRHDALAGELVVGANAVRNWQRVLGPWVVRLAHCVLPLQPPGGGPLPQRSQDLGSGCNLA